MELRETGGDVALTARPATSRRLGDMARLVGPGESLSFRLMGEGVLACERTSAGPRRITHLDCFPEAERLVTVQGASPTWIVLATSGGRGERSIEAFTVPPGSVLLIAPGVWHAGPYALEDAIITELLAVPGMADRIDRRSLQDLVGVEGARILLPEEPGARAPTLDLNAPGGVRIEASMRDRIAAGVLDLEGCDGTAISDALRNDLDKTVESMRTLWGSVGDLAEVPGVRGTRALYSLQGLDPVQVPPATEVLLSQLLSGQAPAASNAFEALWTVLALRLRTPLIFLDSGRLLDRLVLRGSADDEDLPRIEGPPVRRGGVPVLADGRGPVASLVGPTVRARVETGSRRLLAILWLPADLGASSADSMLDGVAGALQEHLGASVRGRRLVP